MIFILLPIVGIIISNAYEKHMVASIENELSAYSYSILAIIEVENNSLVMPEQLLENQFNVSQSGLYAVLTTRSMITKDAIIQAQSSRPEKLWSSQSLLSPWQTENFQQPLLGKSAFYKTDIAAHPHFVYSLSVSYGGEQQPFPMTLHIIKQQNDLALMMKEFHRQLLIGLAGLMLVLLMVQYLWSLWTLKPLKTLQTELSHVEQEQRQRYRNALSDLAHSLKTPLAVMQTQQELSTLTQEQISIINTIIEHQLRKAQSAGQSSWYLGTAVRPIAEKLINSLGKIYRDKNLLFKSNITPECNFRGDEADLLEILGNLLDNACKAAVSQIHLDICADTQGITMIIQDDGLGIAPSMTAEILQRGTRADTYQHGHGIGLAIVRDLVESYQGSILIEHSEQLTGAKFTLTFPS